jgi:signal transduction histidine kinase
LDPSLPAPLFGDEKHLSQVIAHLLTNAVKFTPQHGDILLSVRTLNEDSETVTLQIAITDNGIGISKEHRKKIFDLFEQGNGGSTRKYSGTGLGLHLAKRIVEAMGGKIWVESELGTGSMFAFICKLRKHGEG